MVVFKTEYMEFGKMNCIVAQILKVGLLEM